MLNVLFHWWKSVYPGTHIGEKFCICYDPVFSVVFVVEMIFDASFGHLHYHRSIPEGSKKAACYVCFPGSIAHKTASLSGEVGGSSIPLDVWEMACVFIWPWFHLTHGPPGFNDTLGHRRFKPLTTMFISVSQPVGTGKPFTPVYTRTYKSDNRFLVYSHIFSIGTGNS